MGHRHSKCEPHSTATTTTTDPPPNPKPFDHFKDAPPGSTCKIEFAASCTCYFGVLGETVRCGPKNDYGYKIRFRNPEPGRIRLHIVHKIYATRLEEYIEYFNYSVGVDGKATTVLEGPYAIVSDTSWRILTVSFKAENGKRQVYQFKYIQNR